MTKTVYGILIVFILILGFLFQDEIRCSFQPFLERMINETPKAKIAGYLKAISKGDERKALKLWQLPEWEENFFLNNRRENITKELIEKGLKDFDILNIEWWRTCCESDIINNPQAAGGARIRVKLISRDDLENIYIFDVFHRKGDYWGAAEGCQLRQWVLRDVYPLDQKPLFWPFPPIPKIEQVKVKYEYELRSIPGVVDVGVSECNGVPCLKVYLEKEPENFGFPVELEGFKVVKEIVGRPDKLPGPEDMQNPASLHCLKQGGKLEIRKDKEGNEIGFCLFEDGSECEEWKFFRGECKKGER